VERAGTLASGIRKPLGPLIKLLMRRTAAGNVVRIKNAVER
jgi:hypothetical protein